MNIGVLEASGLVLAVIGLVFAFETPRQRFLRIFGYQAGPTPSLTDISKARRLHVDHLGEFLVAAQGLRLRSREQPIPVAEHNAWVELVSQYLRNHLGTSYEARFSDFSGMTFYGDGSERFKYEQSLDGRSRRLNEFLAELSK